MSFLLTINGQDYIIPEPNEVGWGSNLDAFFTAIAAGVLQKTGGLFTLSADIDFGTAFGLKSLYYATRGTNPATAGNFRLENAASGINWRNATNTANLPLTVDSSNQLTFNGSVVTTSAIVITPGLQYQLGYYATSGSAISPLTLITGSKALQSDSNGLPVASSVTTTELGYVAGVTSSIQTQIDSKEPTITVLPISKGGTNSSTALNNNRVMQSSGGAIVESATITASRALVSDSNGIPTASSVTTTELGYVSGVISPIQTQLNVIAPPGMVVAYGGTSAPTGWLLCDGSAVSRTTYAALFAVVGVNFGVGDGSTTFNLPNTSGIFIGGVGSQTISSITHTIGSLGTVANDQLQGHKHSVTDPGHVHTNFSNNAGVAGTDYGWAGQTTNLFGNQNTGSATTGLTVQNPTTDGSNGTPRTGVDTKPASISMNYIIKT